MEQLAKTICNDQDFNIKDDSVAFLRDCWHSCKIELAIAGTGAKQPRTGIYSEHGCCALLRGNHPNSLIFIKSYKVIK
jgi:hypothetical protein